MTVPYGVGLAAFGGRNAGLRPQARAVSNRRRRLLASVDSVPYGAKNNPVGTPLPGCPQGSRWVLRTPGDGCPYKKKTVQPELHRLDI